MYFSTGQSYLLTLHHEDSIIHFNVTIIFTSTSKLCSRFVLKWIRPRLPRPHLLKASARLVYCAPKYCHVTPLLKELHWLPVRLRADFKILLVTFKILHGVASSCLKDLVSVLPDSRYQLRRNNNGILLERPRPAKNEEDFGRSRVIDGCPLFMEQSSSANKTGNINRLF